MATQLKTFAELAAAIKEAAADEGHDVATAAQPAEKPKRTVVRRGAQAKRDAKQAKRDANDRGNGKRREKRNLERQVGIGWETNAARLVVSIDKGTCQQAQCDGPNTFAQVRLLDRQPETLNVRMELTQLEDNLLKYVVHSGDEMRRVHDCTLPHLTIPVEWRKDGIPVMRQQDVDNCDILLMNGDGVFVQLQISVVVRSGKTREGKVWWRIYLQIQELFSGQVVRTTAAKAEALGLTSVPTDASGVVATVVPLFGYHNRPGTDWLSVKNSEKFGRETLVPTALKEGRSVQLSRAYFEDWQPPALGTPSGENRVRGVVQFYNLIWLGGAGFIQLEDGSSIFVRWQDLRNVHALQPMSVVEFFIGEHKGKEQAKVVKAIAG